MTRRIIALTGIALVTVACGAQAEATENSSSAIGGGEDDLSRPVMHLELLYVDEATGALTKHAADQTMCTPEEMVEGAPKCVNLSANLACRAGSTYDLTLTVRPMRAPITVCPPWAPRDPGDPASCRVTKRIACGEPPIFIEGSSNCVGPGTLPSCEPSRTETADGQRWYGSFHRWVFPNWSEVRRTWNGTDHDLSYPFHKGDGDQEGVVFIAHRTPLPGMHALYNCLDGADHFVSRDTNCEGKRKLDTIGWVFDEAGPGRRPIINCLLPPGDRFVDPSYTCAGFPLVGTLGYTN